MLTRRSSGGKTRGSGIPSSGDAMPRTVPSLASLGAVSTGIPKEATARPHKGQARYRTTLVTHNRSRINDIKVFYKIQL